MFKGVRSVWETIFGFLTSIYLFIFRFLTIFPFPHMATSKMFSKKITSTNQIQIISSLLADAKPLNLIEQPRLRFFRIQLIHPILFLLFQSRPVIQDKVWMIEILDHTKVQAFTFSVTELWTFNKNCSFTLVC